MDALAPVTKKGETEIYCPDVQHLLTFYNLLVTMNAFVSLGTLCFRHVAVEMKMEKKNFSFTNFSLHRFVRYVLIRVHHPLPTSM